jgi:hypothetical protein
VKPSSCITTTARLSALVMRQIAGAFAEYEKAGLVPKLRHAFGRVLRSSKLDPQVR